MPAPLPPGLTAAQFSTALRELRGVVGADWTFSGDDDIAPYADAYAFDGEPRHRPGAAVAPSDVTQLREVLRVANRFRLPLWPISRGKNFGYGGAAPALSGTVQLDLGRMRRILDVDVARATVRLEPGVGFFDLHAFLEREKLPLWASVPGNSLGSVIGNALEYGLGYGPLGDRASSIVGLEVMLPDGSLLRTGMGALRDSVCWSLFRHSYGPSWDKLFMQSNFGIVTQAGVWLQPEPQSVLELSMEVPREQDIGWVVEALAPLRMRGVVQGPVNIGNFMRIAMASGRRAEWYQGEGAIPDAVHARIMSDLGLGWWGVHIALYGEPVLVRAQAAVVKAAFAPHTRQEFVERQWNRGEPRPETPAYGVPISFPLRIANWISPHGGHLGFSPVLPPDRMAIETQIQRSRALFREHGFDFYGGVTLGDRHVNVVNMLAYDRADAAMARRADALFRALMADARARGFGEYRSHLSYMDEVADSYDFGDHAQRRLNEWFKDAVDPRGILAPGKQGIWPRHLRGDKR